MIPQELKDLNRWIVWNVGKTGNKAPYCARTMYPASSTDPSTWSTYEEAIAASSDVGFVFNGDGILGIDLDKCLDEPWALDIIRRANSYTEVSPSGEGYHILVRGVLPPGGNKKGRVEMYSTGRYFTMTGNQVGAPTIIETRDLTKLHHQMLAGELEPHEEKPRTNGNMVISRKVAGDGRSGQVWAWICSLVEKLGDDHARVREVFDIYHDRDARVISTHCPGGNWERRNVEGIENADYIDYSIRNAIDAFMEAQAQTQVETATEIQATPDLVVRNSVEFEADKTIKPRAPLLVINTEGGGDLITERSITQVYARRGTGKTNFLIAVAKALSTGGDFLYFRAVRPVKVLYIEGEMPDAGIQKRIRSHRAANPNLSLVTIDSQPSSQIPFLFTPVGQAKVTKAIEESQSEVVIFDSISSLFSFDTNKEAEWRDVCRWFTWLRNSVRGEGVALIYAHHAGKGLERGSRGHSKGEDPLDVSIELRSNSEDLSLGLVNVSMKFDKLREHVPGTKTLEIAMQTKKITDGTQDSSEIEWSFGDKQTIDKKKAFAMFETGIAVTAVAKILGIREGAAQHLKAEFAKHKANASRPDSLGYPKT